MKTNLKFLNPIKVIIQRRSFNKQVFIFALLITCSVAIQGQKFYSLSLFNHATTLPPKGFTSVLHPGFDIGISWKQKEKKHSTSFIHYKLGYYYHRLVHQGIQLYGEYTKQYDVIKNTGISWSAGLGYLHTLELHEIFKYSDTEKYRRIGKLGSPHAQLSASIGIYAQIKSLKPFIQYRVSMVTPFVNSYVPLLPSTSLHIGTYYSLNTKNKDL
ncbi:MAG: hypothetical protein WBC35_16475 [Saprospiraceae bacterium]|nr:hypothetical protein [Saprospiraceae bacterium]